LLKLDYTNLTHYLVHHADISGASWDVSAQVRTTGGRRGGYAGGDGGGRREMVATGGRWVATAGWGGYPDGDDSGGLRRRRWWRSAEMIAAGRPHLRLAGPAPARPGNFGYRRAAIQTCAL